METNNQETYMEKDMYSFAEYCLERSIMKENGMKHLVTHADLWNWMQKNKVDMFVRRTRNQKIDDILE